MAQVTVSVPNRNRSAAIAARCIALEAGKLTVAGVRFRGRAGGCLSRHVAKSNKACLGVAVDLRNLGSVAVDRSLWQGARQLSHRQG